MATVAIPVEAKHLLHDCVEDFEQLETLLLFAGPHSREWIVKDAAARLGVDEEDALDAMEKLRHAGVLDGSAGARRYIASPRWTLAIDELNEAYQNDRAHVLNLITATALERMRSSATRAFAA